MKPFTRFLIGLIAAIALVGIALQTYSCATLKKHKPERLPPSVEQEQAAAPVEDYDYLNPVHVVGRMHHRGKTVEWGDEYVSLRDHRGGLIIVYYPVDMWEETR